MSSGNILYKGPCTLSGVDLRHKTGLLTNYSDSLKEKPTGKGHVCVIALKFLW